MIKKEIKQSDGTDWWDKLTDEQKSLWKNEESFRNDIKQIFT